MSTLSVMSTSQPLSQGTWYHGVSISTTALPHASTDHLLADSTFTMKADSTQNSVMGKGRDSVRLVSNNDFGDGAYIFDINHMPVGCGTVRSLPALLPQQLKRPSSSGQQHGPLRPRTGLMVVKLM